MREWLSAEEEKANIKSSWKCRLDAAVLALCVLAPLADQLISLIGR